jgi:acetyl-CoA carboxylase carboxyltransferase component
VAWPTGEFGGMGLEGAVRLGLKKQLAAEADPAAREQLFQTAVAWAYERGKAINTASYLEIDGVIDPAETRAWLVRGLLATPPVPPARRFIDTW